MVLTIFLSSAVPNKLRPLLTSWSYLCFFPITTVVAENFVFIEIYVSFLWCYNKFPHFELLTTTEMYSLLVWEMNCLKWRCWQGHVPSGSSRGNSFPLLTLGGSRCCWLIATSLSSLLSSENGLLCLPLLHVSLIKALAIGSRHIKTLQDALISLFLA